MRPRPIKVLYKIHDNPDCLELQDIVRYLHSIGHEARPELIYERFFPSHVRCLPTIIDFHDRLIEGLPQIVEYLENWFGQENLRKNAAKFVKEKPNYRINGN